MATKVARREVKRVDTDALVADFEVFASLKARIKELDTLASATKSRLAAAVEEFGEEDDQGHVWLALPDGRKLKRERRVSRAADEEFAIPFLKAKGLLSCIASIEILDEDEIMAARFKDQLTDEDIEKMYPSRISYAFVPPR